MEQAILERVLDGIMEGEYEDDQLPSENEISQRYRIPRITARRILSSLEDMGYVKVFKGKGRFIRRRAESLVLNMSGAESFSEKIIAAGRKLRTVTRVSEAGNESPAVRRASGVLGLGPGDPVLEVSRLRLIDGEPAAIHYSFLDEKRFPRARNAMPAYPSMFAFFRDEGVSSFSSGRSLLSVCLPRSDEQESLGCSPLVPLLVVDSATLNALDGKVLQASRIVYRGDSFSYCIEE